MITFLNKRYYMDRSQRKSRRNKTDLICALINKARTEQWLDDCFVNCLVINTKELINLIDRSLTKHELKEIIGQPLTFRSFVYHDYAYIGYWEDLKLYVANKPYKTLYHHYVRKLSDLEHR